MPTQVELEELVTKFSADVKDLKTRLREAESSLLHTAGVAEGSSLRVSQAIDGIGRTAFATATAILGLGSAFEAVKRGVGLAADAEAMSTTFRVLIGDAEVAKKTLGELQEFALKTPFEMPELLESAKQMVAFGEDAENIVATMRTLGDVASGLEIPLKDLTYLFGTLKSQGRAFTVDIRQFAMRGIPIYIELAKVFGLVGKEAKKIPADMKKVLDEMIEVGAVDFNAVEKAFQNMTGEGGKFFNMMEERSKTLKGVWTEMKESIDLTLREIGDAVIQGLDLNPLVRQITSVANEFKDWIKALDADTKRAIFIVTGLIGVFVGLSAVISLCGTLITVFSGGLNIWAGLITAAVGLTALWVYQLGDLQEAWKVVKRAATDFWRFIKPALPAIIALMILFQGQFAPLYVAIALLVHYWKDVVRAVEEFYDFAKPTLREIWNLTKLIGFAVRDSLVVGWKAAVREIERAGEAIAKTWKEVTGGQEVDWSRIKTAIRDFVIFVEYAFSNIGMVSKVTWDLIKLQIFGAMDEIMKNVGLVPIAIVAGFVVMAETVKRVFTNMLVALVKGVDEAVQAIWEAIKTGKLTDLQDRVKKIIGQAAADSFVFIDDMKNELQKRIGKVTVNEIERDGIKIPVGFNVQGLQEERQKAFNEVVKGKLAMDVGFKEFKEKRLLQNQLEDAAEMVSEVISGTMIPLMLGLKQPSAEAGKQAGTAFAAEFGKEAKKIEAVLMNSAEAFSRLEEFKDTQPNLLRPTAQTTTGTREVVSWLERIFNVLEKKANEPGVRIVPAEVP